jgi:PPOX class probable F420-dependent enzyme
MDAGWSRARFAETRVARLATADGAGRPHLVPIVFVRLGDAIYSAVDAKPKSAPGSGAWLRRLDNIRANPGVSVLVDHYAEDWRRLWWARADGTARIIDVADLEAAQSLGALADRYPQYHDAPPPGPVIAIAVHRWSGWAASDSGRIP